jgi:hypothetical protein
MDEKMIKYMYETFVHLRIPSFPFLKGNPPEAPSPYLFKKNPPAKQNKNEKR